VTQQGTRICIDADTCKWCLGRQAHLCIVMPQHSRNVSKASCTVEVRSPEILCKERVVSDASILRKQLLCQVYQLCLWDGEVLQQSRAFLMT
jgi:hypothetical protein